MQVAVTTRNLHKVWVKTKRNSTHQQQKQWAGHEKFFLKLAGLCWTMVVIRCACGAIPSNPAFQQHAEKSWSRLLSVSSLSLSSCSFPWRRWLTIRGRLRNSWPSCAYSLATASLPLCLVACMRNSRKSVLMACPTLSAFLFGPALWYNGIEHPRRE